MERKVNVATLYLHNGCVLLRCAISHREHFLDLVPAPVSKSRLPLLDRRRIWWPARCQSAYHRLPMYASIRCADNTWTLQCTIHGLLHHFDCTRGICEFNSTTNCESHVPMMHRTSFSTFTSSCFPFARSQYCRCPSARKLRSSPSSPSAVAWS